MRPVSADQDSSANGARSAQRRLKPYNAPQFKILTPEQAEAELRARALPGDAGTQQLLKIASKLARSRE